MSRDAELGSLHHGAVLGPVDVLFVVVAHSARGAPVRGLSWVARKLAVITQKSTVLLPD